jgi:hypothetical protein
MHGICWYKMAWRQTDNNHHVPDELRLPTFGGTLFPITVTMLLHSLETYKWPNKPRKGSCEERT